MPNGSHFVLGAANTATLASVLNASVPGRPFTGQFRVETKKGGTAIMGKVSGSSAIGVVGESVNDKRGTGVFGQGEGIGVFGLAITNGDSKDGIGVFGDGGDWGVKGDGFKIGVEGNGPEVGVLGRSKGLAGFFDGDVFVNGSFFVTGAKAAVVPHPDGSHRTVFALESPQSWFEDFGRARLQRGRARLALPADFAALVRTQGYHVFCSPEGDCNGLFVTKLTRNGFEVRELSAGTSNVSFSYRIVAQRKDLANTRLPKQKLPEREKAKARAARKPARRS
jgi:hypothetical protein